MLVGTLLLALAWPVALPAAASPLTAPGVDGCSASKNSATTCSNVADWPAYDSASCFRSNPGADRHHHGHIHISWGAVGGAEATSWWQPVMDGHRDSPNGAAGAPTGSGNSAGMPAAVAQGYVTRVCTDLLGRAPDATGRADWVGRLTGGAPIADVADGTTASDGFYGGAGGTNRGWVAALYGTVLAGSAGTSKIDAWAGQLAAGASRVAVARGFLDSAKQRSAVVDGYHLALLGRHADPAGLSGGVQSLLSGTRKEQIVAGLVASSEYVNRSRAADPAPPPCRGRS